MTLTKKTVAEFLESIRSSEPTPGGGSASAFAGAVGASLLAMVAGLPKPRASSPEHTAKLQEAGRRSAAAAHELERLIDRDTDAYNMVVEAFRLPRNTDEETAVRSARIQEALKAATEAPLEVMRRCREALSLEPTVGALGNVNASSDVKVAVYILRAGLDGAGENVEINLERVKDAAYVRRVRDEAAALAGRGS